jgi:HCOMODA/2-hydroxy-3-carboxy-muconic semialdehyde decarboxylase
MIRPINLRTPAGSRVFLAPLIVGTLLAVALACGVASAQSTPGSASAVRADTDEARIDDLVEANHILANEHVLDGFGHVSVRSIKNPRHFYMSRSRAPALVTAADIIELDENSEPLTQHGPALYGERFIHGEILRARPEVQAVVHSHSPQVVPFSVTNTPFQAIAHMAAFLGASPAPVFEIRDVLGPRNDLLVRDNRTGAALAKVLGDRTVVLMRGHGMAVVAPSVRMVVMRAIYTQLNAQIESEALKLGAPTFLNAEEATRTDPADRPWEIWAADADRVSRAR